MGFDAEAFAEVEGVIVAVPGKDSAIAEERGDGGGMVIADAKRKRGATLGGALRIGDAIDAAAGDIFQAVDETPDEAGFVGNGGAIGGGESFAAGIGFGIAAAAEFGEIVDGGADTGDEFVNLRAAFPAIGS